MVGLAVLLGLGLFTLFVVLPRGAEVGAIRDELLGAQGDLAALQGEVAALRAAAEDGTASVDLEAVRRRIPPTPDLPGLIAALEAAATDAGVTLSGIIPGVPAASAVGSASSIPLSLTVSGPYFALARFLHDLEAQERLTKVSAISISGGAEGPLSLQVTAEVYTTDLSAGPGSDPAPGQEVGA